ncbi:MAG: sulfotransferase, partial [Proteobacteria bacterium]|nr:sulfotransferase [Pseudomonadota bacterium]
MPELDPVCFILASGRSGTTLLRVMLAGHPKLFSPPEMLLGFFTEMQARKNFLEQAFWTKGGLRRALMDLKGLSVSEAKAEVEELTPRTVHDVYAYLQSLTDGRTLVDKCIHFAYLPDVLDTVPERFPNARYIWLVRHPGSVIRSYQNMPMAEVMLAAAPGVKNSEDAWLVANRNIAAFLAKQPNNCWMRVRYEDLVTDPQGSLEEVLSLLDLPFDEAVLNPYDGDRMREGPKGARAIGDPNMAGRGKIQPELATAWLKGFDPRSVCGETRLLAKEMGYNLDELELPPMALVSNEMQALFDEVKRLEAEIKIPMDLDALEGRRFLLRMLAESVDTFVEYVDVDNPQFRHAEGPHRKMFGDCPDANYLQAPIKLGDGRVYRLSGRIPAKTTYVGITLYGRGGRIGDRLTDSELSLDEKGRFELLISAEHLPGQHLMAKGDERSVMVRQYFADRSREEAVEVDIYLLGTRPAPAPLDPRDFAKGVERSRRMVKAIFERTLGAYKLASMGALNNFLEIPADQLFPT